MSFLTPLMLLAGVAVAVPLALHLMHRDRRRAVVFPALRYLQRTEKEHARRIRLRQLVVLALRVAVVVLLTLAGARLLVSGAGAAHPPTAVAVVLDNSLSSGRVVGEERLLDGLKRTALTGIAGATSGDRIWVIRAGSPWETAVPLPPAAARARIAETEVSAARGDLSAAVRRARRLVVDADLAGAEVHLVSDLQATGFTDGDADPTAGQDGAEAVPVLVAPAPEVAGTNHYLQDVVLGGGLPPLAGRRTPVAVALAGAADGPVTVRLFVDGGVRGAATLSPGAGTVLPVTPPSDGWLTGWVEADPDALRADDRRWFAAPVAPPPVVAPPGPGHPFLLAALGTLEEGGRITLGAAGDARLVVAEAGAGLELRRPATVVLPPTDPTLLPALNRRLTDAGVPWRYTPPDAGSTGELAVEAPGIPVPLDDVRVRRRYGLEPAAPGAPGRIAGRTGDGAPWAVAWDGRGAARVLLLAHPLEEGWSTLPVDAAMVPFVEWLAASFGASAAGRSHEVGVPLPLPVQADSVRLPDGTPVPTDGTSELRVVAEPGVYSVVRGDSVIDRVAVNPPLAESIHAPLDAAALETRLGPGTRRVDDEAAWSGETFTRRQGFEVWRPLVAAVVVLLLLEGWLAASGAGSPRPAAPRKDARRATARQRSAR